MSPQRRIFRSLNHFISSAQRKQWGGWMGRLVNCLGKLGITWEAAPLRRVVQTLSLGLYLYLFLYVSWPYAQVFTSRLLDEKEWLPVETFLWLDPLAGLAACLADRRWNGALFGMAATLLVCVWIPRAFCGYVCPLGTLIDLFDYGIGQRIRFLKIHPRKGWFNLRFYFLAAILAASCGGMVIWDSLAAIPMLTRGLLFTAGQLQLGFLKNWSMVPAMSPAIYGSIGLFLVVFLLGLWSPRFWCRYVCPSGALVSLPSLLRKTQRRVDPHQCSRCGQCKEACPFDAVDADFRTRTLQCAFCQTCAGVCPREAIDFTVSVINPHGIETPPFNSSPLSRRALILSSISGAATAWMLPAMAPASERPLRPPGSVQEDRFLDLCIRCEQCLKVCPGPVLQAAGLRYGIEALWTPVAVFSHAGCHPECNFCTQACPTSAIRPLTQTEKRRTRIGLAMIDQPQCLPYRGERDCQLCFDECEAAGYHAIEMRRIQLSVGQIPEGIFSSAEIEAMSSIAVPVVKSEACVGCGLCEYRCHSVNARQKKLLQKSAIVIKAL